MSEMKEYYLHILNWAVMGTSPEEAVKEAQQSGGLEGFVFTVTDREGTLVPVEAITGWAKFGGNKDQPIFSGHGRDTVFEICEEVDTAEWDGPDDPSAADMLANKAVMEAPNG